MNSWNFQVSEIFHSVQGEGTRSGMPCTFVRLQGCTLRCVWCDTPYALDKRAGEVRMNGSELLAEIARIGTSFVEFTGGEPLEQPDAFPFMQMLCDKGYTVAVETGGHVDITPIDPRVICIMDVKCPDSKMESLNRYENLELLRLHDEVKFVIASRQDYEFARSVVRKHELHLKVHAVLFSAAFGKIEYVTLVNWILEDQLPVRFQLQIHKYVWSPETRGV